MNEEQMKYMQGAERAIKEERISVEKLVDMEEAAAKGDQEAIESLKQFSIGETISPESNARYQARETTMQGLQEAFERYSGMRPFITMLRSAYPKDAAFFESIGVVMSPIDVYMNEHNLSDASTKEKNTHKKSFLDFFAAYLEEWETSDKQDIEAAQLHIWEALRDKGFISTKAEAVQEQAAETLAIIYEITPDFIYSSEAVMPTGKVTQKQVFIAKHKKGLEVNVGTEKNPVIVKATITNGNISPEAIEIQNVIGEMIQANGMKTPLYVTRAQVWRAFACLEDGAKVTKQNQDFVGVQVTSLAEAEGKIDFTQQVEKHTNMKKEPDYDYKKTIIEGKLVLRDEIKVIAGGHETEGFILYRLPLFFNHSKVTGQIARIDKAFLDTTVAKITDGSGKKRTVETRQNDIGFTMLKRHLARQVEHMKTEKKTEPEGYERRRNFEEIAKAISGNKLTARQMRTMREDIDILCERWKIQGYIKNYAPYKNKGSRAYAGVKIDV